VPLIEIVKSQPAPPPINPPVTITGSPIQIAAEDARLIINESPQITWGTNLAVNRSIPELLP